MNIFSSIVSSPTIYLVVLLLVVATCIKLFVSQSVKAKKGDFSLNNYSLVPSVMTNTEMSFYHSLIKAVNDEQAVMVKVRLADIINIKKGSENYMAHFGKIKAKHVDYLLCNKTDLKPILVIELDDKSHQREDRMTRDKLVDGILKTVGLPVIHYPVKRNYSQKDLISVVSEAIGKSN